jgi:uncharacterized protein
MPSTSSAKTNRAVRSRRKGGPLPKSECVDLGDGVRVERGVRFSVADGTQLVSDHYYPPESIQGTPCPTLLVRQPYGKTIATTVVCAQAAWFARHGYNVVIQDVRGRGESGGSFYPFRDEGRDGKETIDWLARRPESNGRVGMYGFSYQGLTQLLAAAERPAALQCIVPAQTAGDLFNGWFYHHGALRLAGTIGWAHQMLRADARRLSDPAPGRALESAALQLPSLFARSPYAQIPELTDPQLPTYYADWTGHRHADDYWAAMDISRNFDQLKVPALHILGWYDSYLHGSALLYDALTSTRADSAYRDHQYLVAGPWQHIPWGRLVGELDFGPEADFDTDRLLLRWFNHWLKDSGEFSTEPKVRLFAMGENRWKTCDSWTAYGKWRGPDSVWYLHSQGRANSSRGDGRLTAEPASSEPRDSWVDEPEVPVLSPGPQGSPGPFNQARAEQLNNVLVYTSEPLSVPLTVAGAPKVILYSTSSRPHADLVAKLLRVLPDGRSFPVSLGIARSSWMFPPGTHKADTIHRWDFPLEPTCCTFAPGERLRLDISGSAFPLYDRNPGSDVPPQLATPSDWRHNLRQLMHTGSHLSQLVLPLLP